MGPPQGPAPDVAYLTVKPSTLNLGGWLTLVQEMETMDELWRDASAYLAGESAIRRAPSTFMDIDQEDSQLVVLDDQIMNWIYSICKTMNWIYSICIRTTVDVSGFPHAGPIIFP